MTNLVSTSQSVAACLPETKQVKTGAVPAVVLGGGVNALSVVRSLGRAGIPNYVLNQADSAVRHSRHGRWLKIEPAATTEESWANFLLGPQSESLRGAVLIACCDPALQLLAKHRAELAGKFRLDEVNPAAQVAMLNKLRTYQIAAKAGVDTPRFWILQPGQDLESLAPQFSYPLIVKPSHTHVFRNRFGKKFVIANDFASLKEAYQLVQDQQMEVMLVEFIPGLDDRLCSYYTYLDETGSPQFHFTKRVIRRYPLIVGNGCHHITDWNPEVRDAGLAFLQAAGVRGLGNVEFKRDPRDGRLKLIECNARLTEANCLVAAAGLDLPLFIYNRLTGGAPVPLQNYKTGLRLWYPIEDFHAFRQLRREGKITWGQWLTSIAGLPSFPKFRWLDPGPSVVGGFRRVKEALMRRLGR